LQIAKTTKRKIGAREQDLEVTLLTSRQIRLFRMSCTFTYASGGRGPSYRSEEGREPARFPEIGIGKAKSHHGNAENNK